MFAHVRVYGKSGCGPGNHQKKYHLWLAYAPFLHVVRPGELQKCPCEQEEAGEETPGAKAQGRGRGCKGRHVVTLYHMPSVT